MATLVITCLGNDRAGLVDALSGAIADHHGNWHRSNMVELAGKFAGLVQVTVPGPRTADLIAALEELEADGLLDITVERAGVTPEAPDGSRASLQILGQDQPGIVHKISSALASCGVNIDELRTDTLEAPMAGGLLFQADAQLELPPGLTFDALRIELEDLSGELMVDIDVLTAD